MAKSSPYAVITGASKGLGKAYAMELARMGKNLILAALPEEGLQQVADEIKNQNPLGAEIVCYETNFCNKNNILDFAQWVNEHYETDMLINNAGTGGSMAYTEASVAYIDSIIQLNITAPSLLTHQLLPNLLKQPRAYILNVASMATFIPMAFKTVYPASKRFLKHFSDGLQQELKDTGISISCVYPGPMRTNNEVNNRINRYGFLGKLMIMTPEEVAHRSLQKLFRKEKHIIPGWTNKLYWFMMTKFPSRLMVPLVASAVKKELLREKQSCT